ncbi:MAG: T9SS type A sorting domain-containing protein [Bacteroidetes bacterium]|nr:T9SS type A sorting domain-containing protein [Bacteroidota bacterium]
MKTITTTCMMFMFFATLNAQTLTYSTFSTALSAVLPASIANNSSFNPALISTTGNGVMWDATSLTPMSGIPVLQLIYGSPASTPHAALYPFSNYVQYDPALTATFNYDYLIISSDSVAKAGDYAPSGKHEIYQNPDKHLIFPFAYGQSFTDTYAKTNYSDATTVSSYQTGSRTVTFNGYGTLMLPMGNFTNVGLFTSVRTNSLGPNSTTLIWIDLNDGQQLLYFSENDGSVIVAYNPGLSSALAHATDFATVSVAPNPFSTTCILNIALTELSRNPSLTIYDQQGRTIETLAINSNQMMLTRDGLANGTYIYVVRNNNKIVTRGKLGIN